MKTALAYVVQPPPGSTKPDLFHVDPLRDDEGPFVLANEGPVPDGCEEGDTLLVRYDPADQFATALDAASVEALIEAARGVSRSSRYDDENRDEDCDLIPVSKLRALLAAVDALLGRPK